MGQAASPPIADSSASDQTAPPSLASADDLLAQLAGEEIDRLLAEVDEQPPLGAPNTQPTALSPSSPAASDAMAPGVSTGEALDKSLKEVDEKLADVSAKLSASEAAVEQELAELEHLSAKATAAAPIEDSALDDARALLDEADPTNDPAEIDDVLSASDQPLPFYVRVLEALNAPLDWLPTDVRETLGKVAILTMVNSLAVLIYVIIFRRH